MKLSSLQKIGGMSLIGGATLLTAYSIFFSSLLPIGEARIDMTRLILNPNWIWITTIAFIGVMLMVFGFAAVYTKIYEESGLLGILGFIFVEVAYILQACKITWEIFLYPIISVNKDSIFLLRDSIIRNNSLVTTFETISSITIFLGILLFCATIIRSKVLPNTAGILIFAGALIYGLGPIRSVYLGIIGICIFSIGCFILGISLYRSQKV